MVSKAKLYSRLDALEEELKTRLLPHLKSAVEEKNDLIFCVTAFNPSKEMRHKNNKLTAELIDIGSQILSLREKLGEPTEGTIAERICWYCREWVKTNNKPPPGAGLAKQFLDEIENS